MPARPLPGSFYRRFSLAASRRPPVFYAGTVGDRWTCPKCKRVFGRRNQSHLRCEPARSRQDYFASAKPWEEPLLTAVEAHFEGVGDIIVDPLEVGILLKNGPMFAELRPKAKWTALGFNLGRKLTSGKLSRKVVSHGKKYFHVINVREPDELDDEILGWLTEAYHLAGGTQPGADPMVPDDIDVDL